MRPGLSLRVTQQLALTPQLQQSIRLLQLSTLELTQEIDQMLVDNPFLERHDDDAADADDTAIPDPVHNEPGTATISVAPLADSTVATAEWDEESAPEPPSWSDDWDGDTEVALTPDDRDWGSDAPPRLGANGSDDEPDPAAWAQVGETLREHLQRQTLALRLDHAERLALTLLIESLDDDGYLGDSLEDLVPTMRASLPELPRDTDGADDVALSLLQRALCWLHSLEPCGVGARNLAECLDLQLRARAAERPCPVTALARSIVAQPLDLLARRDWRRLGVLCHATEVELRAAASLVTRLEPKPGRRFIDVERQLVVPDVLVLPTGRAGNRQWQVRLNDAVLPRLRLVERYAQALRTGRSSNAASHATLQTHLQEARWFLKNIQQRFDTILRVSRAIVERQKGFLTHGELAMRPLVLREIADELGLHESTISRVTSGKYMSTPQGTFELKYFFGSGLDTDTGGAASSTAVRALIKQFVAAEDAQRPLSDGQISDLLRQQGIACARRTVAKYREALKIAPTTLRKSL